MAARVIQAEKITSAVEKLLLDCNYFIGKDIACAFE